MKDSKKKEDEEVRESEDSANQEDKDLFLEKLHELEEINNFVRKELVKSGKHPEEVDVEFKIISRTTLISIIKDLQTIGIEGKNPKKVLKELKKLRASREKIKD